MGQGPSLSNSMNDQMHCSGMQAMCGLAKPVFRLPYVPLSYEQRVKGAKLPDNAIQAAKDVQAYIDKGATSPALEFVSPIKGPSLEQITVAVGSGLTTPAEGAAQYDKDVEKQAKQLGLQGW